MTITRACKSVLAVFLVMLAATGVQAEVSLNGLATHSELGKELFIAGLYTSTPSTDKNAILLAQEEKQIQVRVTTEKLSSRRFKRMWIEGMAVNARAAELAEHSNNMAAFANMLKVRMIEGDIFTVARYIENGDTGVRVSVNGATLGEIGDPEFFDLLLRTWLGPVPLSSEFRSSLAQAGNVDSALLARYRATAPSDERIAEVENALADETEVAAASNRQQSGGVDVPAPSVAAPTPPSLAPTPAGTDEQEEAEEEPVARDTPVAIAKPELDQQGSQAEEAAPETETQAAQGTQVARAERSSVLEDEEEAGPELTGESILQQQLYVNDLRRYTYNYLEYPSSALSRGKEGSLRMDVIIDRQGNVLQAEIVEESKYRPFNREAQKAVRQAEPFPAVPEEVQGETFTFTLPIVFVLGDN